MEFESTPPEAEAPEVMDTRQAYAHYVDTKDIGPLTAATKRIVRQELSKFGSRPKLIKSEDYRISEGKYGVNLQVVKASIAFSPGGTGDEFTYKLLEIYSTQLAGLICEHIRAAEQAFKVAEIKPVLVGPVSLEAKSVGGKFMVLDIKVRYTLEFIHG